MEYKCIIWKKLFSYNVTFSYINLILYYIGLIFSVGPGLAIRILCQQEAFLRSDFAATNNVLNLLTTFSQSYHVSSPGVKELMQILSPDEKSLLFRISENTVFSATLLPIHTVGVQVQVTRGPFLSTLHCGGYRLHEVH